MPSAKAKKPVRRTSATFEETRDAWDARNAKHFEYVKSLPKRSTRKEKRDAVPDSCPSKTHSYRRAHSYTKNGRTVSVRSSCTVKDPRTVKELRDEARKRGLFGIYRMRKEELIEALANKNARKVYGL